MTRIALGKLGLDERGGRASDDFGRKPRFEGLEQGAHAQDQPRVEHGRARGHVGEGEFQTLVDRAGRMADFEIEVPEQHQHVLDDTFTPGRLLVG